MHRCPVFILTDADPHGISIAACYARAIQSLELYWVGIHPSQCNKLFTVQDNAKLPLTSVERTIAINLRSECEASMTIPSSFCVEACREINVMLEQGFKFELEAIEPLVPAISTNSNPLLDYVSAVVSSHLS